MSRSIATVPTPISRNSSQSVTQDLQCTQSNVFQRLSNPKVRACEASTRPGDTKRACSSARPTRAPTTRETMVRIPLQALKTVVAEIQNLRDLLKRQQLETDQTRAEVTELKTREKDYEDRLSFVREATYILNQEVSALAESNEVLAEGKQNAEQQVELLRAEVEELRARLQTSEENRMSLRSELQRALEANAELERRLLAVRPNPLLYRTQPLLSTSLQESPQAAPTTGTSTKYAPDLCGQRVLDVSYASQTQSVSRHSGADDNDFIEESLAVHEVLSGSHVTHEAHPQDNRLTEVTPRSRLLARAMDGTDTTDCGFRIPHSVAHAQAGTATERQHR